MRIMIRILVLIVSISFLASIQADGQVWRMRRYEAMAGIGTANYFGDIGGFTKGENLLGLRDIRILKTRPSIYLGARYKLSESMAVTINLTYGYLSGSDSRGSNVARDYAFSCPIFEPSLQYEYYFIKDKMTRSYLMMKGWGVMDFIGGFSLYGFAGAGGALYFPKQNEKLINRAGEITSGAALVFPAGLGVKYNFSPRTALSLEVGGRLTTTDKIDGFPSEYSRANDVYYFGVVSYMYKLKTSRKGWPMFKE